MPDQLNGVHTHVRIEQHPEERALTLWVKTRFHKASTYEMRTLARHILEQCDATDTEANRKKRFFEELPPPEPVTNQITLGDSNITTLRESGSEKDPETPKET